MLKRMLRLAIVLAIITALPAPRPAMANPMKVQEFVLKNGLKVLLVEEPKAPVITVQIWYKVGSRNEVMGRAGLSHMLEHMMFKGTPKYGKGEFSKIIKKNGGNDNAFTSQDYTAYFESRLPGLKRWMHRRCREEGSTLDSLSEAQKQTYAEDYFRLNTQFLPGDKPIDPLLKIYHAMGAYFPRLVPNAYQDELSMNYGVVAVYENPLPSFLNKSPKLRKSAALAVRGISRSHYLTKRIF